MKQYSLRDFERILKKNGYRLDRTKGDHSTYVKENCNPITVPTVRLKSVIVLRLIKENNLVEK